MTSSRLNRYPPRLLLTGGLIFSLVYTLLEINGIGIPLIEPISDSIAWAISPAQGKAISTLAKDCESEIVDTAQLSREQLLELLSVPERDSKSRVREIVQEPYCQLSTLQIRAGVDAVREAYPLEFDPKTTLVILYENDEYAGYRFKH
jgi:hypothetical protein